MSISKKIRKGNKLLLLRNVIFGVLFIFVASINDNPSKRKARKPSSTPNIQLASQNSFLKNPLVKHTRKLSLPMITSIKSINNIKNSGDTINITGHLKVTNDIKNVKIKWMLPPDIELISGSQTSFLSSTESGQDYQFQITIKSNSDINQIIHLTAEAEEGDNFYSNSSQFNTVQQNNLNQEHEKLFERSQEYAKEQAKLKK